MMYGLLPIFCFPVLLWIGREELGLRWVAALLGLAVAGLMAMEQLQFPGVLFILGLTLLDAVLLMVIFRGGTRTR